MKRNNAGVVRLLLQWSNLPPCDATWEDDEFLLSTNAWIGTYSSFLVMYNRGGLLLTGKVVVLPILVKSYFESIPSYRTYSFLTLLWLIDRCIGSESLAWVWLTSLTPLLLSCLLVLFL